jgi:hypothetical protein
VVLVGKRILGVVNVGDIHDSVRNGGWRRSIESIPDLLGLGGATNGLFPGEMEGR